MTTMQLNATIPGPRRSMPSSPPPLVVVMSKMIKMNTTSRRSVVSIPPVAAVLLTPFVARASSTCSATDPERAFVKETISSHNIVIFSKSYCPYCKTAKAVFKEMNQSPHIIELDERDDGQSLQDALSEMVGRRTVPQVFVNGKHIGGSDDTVEAYESGTLPKLLGVSKDDL